MGNSFFPNVTLTDDIYWAAKPPAVRKLRNLPSGEAERDGLSFQLAQSGYTIDVPIDVWNWDAVTTMALRQQAGYTWVPSALMAPITGPPGIAFPGAQKYDPLNPPPGSIKVSTDARDYPPFDPPPPPVVQGTNVVGWLIFGNIYTYGPGAIVNGQIMLTDGQVVTQDGVQYKAHVAKGASLGMGTAVYFERVT